MSYSYFCLDTKESLDLLGRNILQYIARLSAALMKYLRILIQKWKKYILAHHVKGCNLRSEDPICFGVLERQQENVVEQNCSTCLPGNKRRAPRNASYSPLKLSLQWSKDVSWDYRGPIRQMFVLIPECMESNSHSPY